MTMRRLAMALIGAALLAAPALAARCGEGKQATALIVDDLDIDGDLSDWPSDLERHHIGGSAPATFRVAWSPETDRIFVAIEVEDDVIILGNTWTQTDAVEVYTWGGDPTGDQPCEPRGHWFNPIQFAAVPGPPGEYIRGCGNPCAAGPDRTDPTRFGTRAAWRKEGKTLSYEWALPVFGDFRQGSIELTAGRGIGFDVVVVDHNGGSFNWTPWGNPATTKFASPQNVATLVLSGESADSPVWAWLGDVTRAVGRFFLYGVGLVALVVGGLVARGAIRGRGGASGRLDALERRMTDTQDVLIALSEKYDRLEAHVQALSADTKHGDADGR